MSPRANGILMGSIALLLWSTSSATTVLTGALIGPWQFLALSGLIAATTQFLVYRFVLKMPARRLLCPPPKLLGLILLTFVVYMLVYTLALVLATRPQKVGVNLANFLWPTLTILLAVFLVPGARMSGRLMVAVVLAFTGVLLANARGLHELMAAHSGLSPLPYLFGLMAGISWAVYSATLARWRSWAREYATSPLGFLLTSLIAFSVCLITRTWTPMTGAAWAGVLVMAFGSHASAYLLWERAIHRAPAQTLGLLASANAVLSTLWLFAIYRFLPGNGQPPSYVHALLAASLITLAIIVGARTTSGGRRPAGKRLPGKESAEPRAVAGRELMSSHGRR